MFRRQKTGAMQSKTTPRIAAPIETARGAPAIPPNNSALAPLLSLQPDVWLLDEPTASLDPRSQSRPLDFIDELGHDRKTIITATHDLDIVEEIADRVVLFCEEHEMTGEGAPHEVFSDYDRLVECNLIHEHRHQHDGAEHVHNHLHPTAHKHEHER